MKKKNGGEKKQDIQEMIEYFDSTPWRLGALALEVGSIAFSRVTGDIPADEKHDAPSDVGQTGGL